MRDYYYILGVAENAPIDQIKSAFRKLSMKFHPDKNNGEKFYEDQFRAILEAWDVLSDPSRKAVYDQQLRRFKAAAAEAAYKDALIRKYEAELRKYNAYINQQQPQTPPPARQHPFWEWFWQHDKTSGHNGGLPWRAILLTGAVLFFFCILLYLFGPQGNIRYKRNEGVYTYSGNEMKEASNAVITRNDASGTAPLTISRDAVLLMDEGKSIVLDKYLSDPARTRNQYKLKDIDNDSLPELQITYHTGGAHCCNVDHLFRQASSNKYQLIFSYMGGMYMADNKLSLYFYQDLGYYHSCYGCTITSKLPRQDVNAEINMIFDHGKLQHATTDEKLNESIHTNLSFITRRGIPAMNADGLDDGSRKEIMLHMMAYHFNNHDKEKTKALFDRYYTWTDSIARWNDLETMITRYEEIIFQNDAYRKKQTF